MPLQALLFDVFGTVVDWRSSLLRRFERFARENKLGKADWAGLIDDWRGEYRPSMDAVRSGRRAWTSLESLHRESLDKLLERYRLTALTDSQRKELVEGWHFLDPWPDAVAGLTRLKRGHIIGTLSNGGVRLLTDMAKYAGLPWDVIFASDLFRHFKPDVEVYRGAIDLLCLPPEQVMLVAAHNYDLAAARRCGMKTGFVARPEEYGPRQTKDLKAEADWDVVAGDFGKLADKLGA